MGSGHTNVNGAPLALSGAQGGCGRVGLRLRRPVKMLAAWASSLPLVDTIYCFLRSFAVLPSKLFLLCILHFWLDGWHKNPLNNLLYLMCVCCLTAIIFTTRKLRNYGTCYVSATPIGRTYCSGLRCKLFLHPVG